MDSSETDETSKSQTYLNWLECKVYRSKTTGTKRSTGSQHLVFCFVERCMDINTLSPLIWDTLDEAWGRWLCFNVGKRFWRLNWIFQSTPLILIFENERVACCAKDLAETTALNCCPLYFEISLQYLLRAFSKPSNIGGMIQSKFAFPREDKRADWRVWFCDLVLRVPRTG